MGSILGHLASTPDQRRVRVIGLVDALGSGLLMPLSVIYLTREVGLSATHVGLGLTIAGSVAVGASLVGGALVSRFDPRHIAAGCFAVSALGFLAYIAVGSFAAFVPVAVAVQAAAKVDRPATAALVLEANSGAAAASVIGLASQQTVRNAGYGVGSLCAALVVLLPGRAPFDTALLANAASYVIAACLVLQLPAATTRPANAAVTATGFDSGSHRTPGGSSTTGRGLRVVLRDRPFVVLAGLDVSMALHDSILRVAMPLWIVTRTHAPLAMSGILFALNTIMVTTLQLRASRTISARHAVDRSYLRAAIALAACAGLFAAAGGAPAWLAIVLLLLAMTALSVAEIENTAGEAILAVGLAPGPMVGRYIALLKTSMSLQQAVGPALVTLALTQWGRSAWIAFGGIAAASALASRFVGDRELRLRRAGASREDDLAASPVASPGSLPAPARAS